MRCPSAGNVDVFMVSFGESINSLSIIDRRLTFLLHDSLDCQIRKTTRLCCFLYHVHCLYFWCRCLSNMVQPTCSSNSSEYWLYNHLVLESETKLNLLPFKAGFASGAGELLGPITIADIWFVHERETALALWVSFPSYSYRVCHWPVFCTATILFSPLVSLLVSSSVVSLLPIWVGDTVSIVQALIELQSHGGWFYLSTV